MVTSQTSTTFVTLPPPTTTTTLPRPAAVPGGADGAGEDGNGPDETEGPRGPEVYTVVDGDYMVRIARRFDVEIDDLVAYNGWEGPNHALYTGDEVLIPPEGYDPDGTVAADGEAPASSAPDDTGLCPDGSEPATYEIRAGDTPRIVARRLGVTVAELDAVNTTTPFYRGFVIGIEINVPC